MHKYTIFHVGGDEKCRKMLNFVVLDVYLNNSLTRLQLITKPSLFVDMYVFYILTKSELVNVSIWPERMMKKRGWKYGIEPVSSV